MTPTQSELIAVQRHADRQYNVGYEIRLAERVDKSRWRAALTRLHAQDDGLRTAISDDGTVQFVGTGIEPQIQFLDEDQFDPRGLLEQVIPLHGPLYRNYFTSGDASRLLLVAPHFVLDGVSARAYFGRVLSFYYEVATRDSYPSVYDWKSPIVTRTNSERSLTYWTKEVESWGRGLRRGPLEPRIIAEETLLSASSSARIRRTAKELTLSPAAIFRAILARLLERLFGPDGAFAFFELRDLRGPEFVDMIGCGFSTSPIAVDGGNLIQATDLEVVTHLNRQSLLGATRPVSHNAFLKLWKQRFDGPLFYLNYYNFEHLSVGDYDFRLLAHDTYGPGEVHVIVHEQKDAFGLELHAPDWTFHDAHVLRHLATLCEEFGNQSKALQQVPIVTEQELPNFKELEAGASAVTSGNTPERIAELAVSNPDLVAVRFNESTVTYGELLKRADLWAETLRRHRVGPDTLVGVHLERSIELPIALVAVWRAGAGFVPLDPSYPIGRVAQALEASNPVVLITTRRGLNDLSGVAGHALPGSVLFAEDLDSNLPDTSPEPLAEALPTIQRSNIAYVLFTSGSTGRPKGAVLEHGSLMNRLVWMQAHFNVTTSDRILQKTPTGFDVSVWELFLPLMSGATLVMAEPGAHLDNSALVNAVRRHEITIMHFVPSMLESFLDSGPDPSELDSLRSVVCSGEALTRSLVEKFGQLGLTASLANLYGPTEATIDVSYWDCEARRDGKVPIGRAVWGTNLYVVDRFLSRLPIGWEGELLIGGIQLAREYLGDAQQTSARFVELPSSGERVYRTGDRAVVLEDGLLEYRGRNDDQLKINGVRIELGEVENVLLEHPLVRACRVIRRRTKGSLPMLAAYFIPESDVDISAIRNHLKQRIPSPALPRVFVELDEFPLTPSGKLDRAALPDIAETRRGRSFKPPRDDFEQTIASVVSSIIGGAKVGRSDDFFGLGLSSVMALDLAQNLQRSLGLPVSVGSIVSNPSVSELARALSLGTAREQERPSFLPHPDDVSLPEELCVSDHTRKNRECTLVTGGTGFLGSHVVARLLENKDEVICLIRARDDAHARQRLLAAFAAQEIPIGLADKHLVTIAADLGTDNLGLANDRYQRLQRDVSRVYHLAAEVNATLPYTALRQSNVIATKSLLRFCFATPSIDFHFVSTLGVLTDVKQTPEVVQESDVASYNEIVSGYSRSKLVAEDLVREAARRGLRCSIHRPGRVGGDSRSGAANARDMFWIVVEAIHKLRSVPQADTCVELLPVDRCARALVEMGSAVSADEPVVTHLFPQRAYSWAEVVRELVRIDSDLSEIPFAAWRRRLLSSALHGTDLRTAAVLVGDDDALEFMPEGMRVETKATEALLGEPVLQAPENLGPYLEAQLSYFRRQSGC